MKKGLKIVLTILLIISLILLGIGVYYHFFMMNVSFYTESKELIEKVRVKKGDTVKLVTEPVLKNSTFIGWAIDNNKDNIFNKDTKIEKDYNLYAAYIHFYEVSFKDEDGTELFETQMVKEGELATKPEDPVKKRADFLEWTVDNNSFSFDSSINKDITIIPSWKKYSKVEEETKELPIFAFNCYTSNFQTLENVKKGQKIICEVGMELFNGMCIKSYSFQFETGSGVKLAKKSKSATLTNGRYTYNINRNNCGVISDDGYYTFEVTSTSNKEELYITLSDPRFISNDNTKYYALERKITFAGKYKKETLE